MAKELNLFAINARKRMKELDIGVAELARRLEVPSSNVSMYLGGDRTPKEETLQRYAEKLECDADWLAGRTTTDSVRVREPSKEELLIKIIERWDLDPARKAVAIAVLSEKDTKIESLAKLLKVTVPAATTNKNKSDAG